MRLRGSQPSSTGRKWKHQLKSWTRGGLGQTRGRAAGSGAQRLGGSRATRKGWRPGPAVPSPVLRDQGGGGYGVGEKQEPRPIPSSKERPHPATGCKGTLSTEKRAQLIQPDPADLCEFPGPRSPRQVPPEGGSAEAPAPQSLPRLHQRCLCSASRVAWGSADSPAAPLPPDPLLGWGPPPPVSSAVTLKTQLASLKSSSLRMSEERGDRFRFGPVTRTAFLESSGKRRGHCLEKEEKTGPVVLRKFGLSTALSSFFFKSSQYPICLFVFDFFLLV